jgi:hypothetical protein
VKQRPWGEARDYISLQYGIFFTAHQVATIDAMQAYRSRVIYAVDGERCLIAQWPPNLALRSTKRGSGLRARTGGEIGCTASGYGVRKSRCEF